MIIRSPYPDVAIPEQPFTDFVLQQAQRLADKPALIDGPSGRALTYGQLAAAIRRAAAGLAARGFRKGDVLALYSPNLPEYAVVFNAVASLGGINTTINPLYTAEELALQLNDSGARFLVTVGPFLDKAQDAAGQSKVEEIFVIGEGNGGTPFSALMETDTAPPDVNISPREDLVVLPYSSGTTGLPKGVMLTHYNLVANICQTRGMGDFSGFGEQDTIIAVLPFFHIYGMIVVMSYGLSQGATIVSMPRFDMAQFLEIMQQHKVTIAPLVPPIVLGLAKQPVVDNYDLSSLRLIFSGAAPLGEGLQREASRRLGCEVIQGYGMTEASPVTHLSPDTPGMARTGSVGFAVPNTEVKLVSTETGAECETGEEGELYIRGPQIMRGYLNRPQETAECLDEEGWYHSGDIGYVDEDGFFFIVDRVKELIKYKGMQVAPAELEALLLTHPAVADVAVVPSPDEEAGELPKAFVVKSGEVTAEALMAFTAEHKAPHKRIRLVEFVDEIPKSASGKILRRVLVDRERSRVAG